MISISIHLCMCIYLHFHIYIYIYIYLFIYLYLQYMDLLPANEHFPMEYHRFSWLKHLLLQAMFGTQWDYQRVDVAHVLNLDTQWALHFNHQLSCQNNQFGVSKFWGTDQELLRGTLSKSSPLYRGLARVAVLPNEVWLSRQVRRDACMTSGHTCKQTKMYRLQQKMLPIQFCIWISSSISLGTINVRPQTLGGSLVIGGQLRQD